MATSRRKNLDRGIKSPVGTSELRPRTSRHGRIMVGAPSRDMEDQRPSPYVKRLRTIKTNPTTGEIEVVYTERPMTLEEVQAERAKVKRALSSTGKHGLENKPDNMAPKGKGGAKPAPGGKK